MAGLVRNGGWLCVHFNMHLQSNLGVLLSRTLNITVQLIFGLKPLKQFLLAFDKKAELPLIPLMVF